MPADLAELTSPPVDHQLRFHRTLLPRRRLPTTRPATIWPAHVSAFSNTSTDDNSSQIEPPEQNENFFPYPGYLIIIRRARPSRRVPSRPHTLTRLSSDQSVPLFTQPPNRGNSRLSRILWATIVSKPPLSRIFRSNVKLDRSSDRIAPEPGCDPSRPTPNMVDGRRTSKRGVVQVPHQSKEPGTFAEDRSNVLTLICRQQ